MGPARIKDIIGFLLEPEEAKEGSFLHWPPDVFAVAGHLLQLSGAYAEVVKSCAPGTFHGKRWQNQNDRLGLRWRQKALCQEAPREIRKWWRCVLSKKGLLVSDIRKDPELWGSLIRLCAAADSACSGMGMGDRGKSKDSFALFSSLTNQQTLYNSPEISSTLCKAIDPSRLIVLPKTHTPQKGITFRSLSHHLALSFGSDVVAKWWEWTRIENSKFIPKWDHGVTVLVVPYPWTVFPSQFKPARPRAGQLPDMDERFGFFQYCPRSIPEDFVKRLRGLCKEARNKVGRLDGVIFPEAALEEEAYPSIRSALLREGVSFCIAGVCKPSLNGRPALNYAQITLRINEEYFAEYRQYKHHRWFLEENQIRQYGLGSTLNPNTGWWEFTALQDRVLNFFCMNTWLTLSVLICEDLARPDPVGNMLRAVGPNLVVALLQDGPQLANRWAARCATVLADDPGSSVLTLTSAGMAEMCSPLTSEFPPKSSLPVIGLWKDRVMGTREIALPSGAEAVVLCLTHTDEREWTADGRHDNQTASVLKLSGVHPIRPPQAVGR